MTIEHTPSWRVRRTGGLLVPGFSKRFDPDGSDGMTYLLGIPVGRFDVVASSADDSEQGVELRYRRWPIVDVLADSPVEPARAPSRRAPRCQPPATCACPVADGCASAGSGSIDEPNFLWRNLRWRDEFTRDLEFNLIRNSCSSSNVLVPKNLSNHERANQPRGWGAKPRVSSTGCRESGPGVEEAELPNGEQPRTGKLAVTRGRKADGPAARVGVAQHAALAGYQVAGLPKGRSLNPFNDDLKGVLMRCMWFTESTVTDEATGVAEYRADSLR